MGSSISNGARVKLQLAAQAGWTAESLSGPASGLLTGHLRYVIPSGPEQAPGPPDSVLIVCESLPLPLDLGGWPLAALSRLKTALLPALPQALATTPSAAASAWRVQIQSSRALVTATGWPATLVHAVLADGREKPLAGCIAALYRFVTYGAEAVFVSALSSGDRGRFGALREPILNALATGRPLWPRGEPPSLHHMLHDEPQS